MSYLDIMASFPGTNVYFGGYSESEYALVASELRLGASCLDVCSESAYLDTSRDAEKALPSELLRLEFEFEFEFEFESAPGTDAEAVADFLAGTAMDVWRRMRREKTRGVGQLRLGCVWSDHCHVLERVCVCVCVHVCVCVCACVHIEQPESCIQMCVYVEQAFTCV